MKPNVERNKCFVALFRCASAATVLAILAALALGVSSSVFAEPRPGSIPLSEIGARASAECHGDALAVTRTPEGAHLRCGFQKLEGYATREGLWLVSTAPKAGGKLRLSASAIGRANGRAHEPAELDPGLWALGVLTEVGDCVALAATGSLWVDGSAVEFMRPGVAEEYSVSVDGVRQDFVISDRPVGAGDLRVELALDGARAEASACGARLTLASSGRALAYSRLQAADAKGRRLSAHLEVPSADRIVICVADTDAAYPIRIDPTFSDANWVSLNPGRPGADWDVYALAADSSGNLYVGGGFTFIGTVSANAVAKWDGTAWSALGSGMPDGSVICLAVMGTDLYAGGNFTSAGGVSATNIARWDGSGWSALGSGTDELVYDMAFSGTNLYAGGYFTMAGGVTANYIARWNGSAWSALGSGLDNRVYTVATSGSNVYVGGAFTTAGGDPANHIAQWNGSGWSPLGSGTEKAVEVLTVSGNDVYAGGDFITAGSVTANYIAKWDGGTWSSLGSGMDWPVYSLLVNGGDLYAGGDFGMAGGVPADFIAKWDGTNWSALGPGGDNTIWDLVMCGTNLYAGGSFQVMGDETAFYIAKWDNSVWSSLTAGMDWNVYAFAVSGSDLYAGGGFTTAGSIVGNGIAKWNGTAWSALGSGMGVSDPWSYPYVYALAVIGTNLYAGGYFETAGGMPATNIALWNGSEWFPVGSGVDDTVRALAVSGSDLYVGGSFSTVSSAEGTLTVNHIAKWSGGTWSALGSGVGNTVSALAVSGSDLYVGGAFTTASGVPANYVAKWDGNAWSALGLGMDDYVKALAVSGTNLYAGGYFTTTTDAGGTLTVNHIAKWDGNAWSALGSGMDDWVYALALNGSELYAGGYFTTAGGEPANYIAKWDGNAWSALGSGVNSATTPVVRALAADAEGHLFVGGYFDFAGTNASPFVAKANVTPLRGVILNIGVNSGSVRLDCQGAPGYVYDVQRAADVRFTRLATILLSTNAPPDSLFRCTDTSPPGAAAFYRLLRR